MVTNVTFVSFEMCMPPLIYDIHIICVDDSIIGTKSRKKHPHFEARLQIFV